MKNKRLAVAAILAVVSTASLAAAPLRLGLEFGSPSGVIVVRPGRIDIKVGYDFTALGSNAGSDFLHVSTDYRIIDTYPLIDFISLYLSAGGYIDILTGDTQDNFVLGGRLPVGVQAFLVNGTVEIFLEVVPTVKFIPTIVAFEDWQGFVGFTVAVPRKK